MLLSRKQKPIPERLSHYTGMEALKSILSDIEGKGICFRAFSNKYKNDDQEIKIGEYMFKRVLEVLPSGVSLLHQFSGYENSASISFMEGDVNQHMLDEYGHFRLEFDLRKIGIGFLTGGLVDCEYVAESELEEYADEYCEMISAKFNSIPALQEKFGKVSAQPFNSLIEFFMMELDIMAKVVCMKDKKWGDEKEWRKVFELKHDNNVLYHDGKPYIQYYIDKAMLTGITVFCSSKTTDKAQKNADDILQYIAERGYNAKVQVEIFE